MVEAVIDRALAHAEVAELYSSESSGTVVEFRANELHGQVTRLARGFGLRVVKDGRVGFASSTDDASPGDLAAAALATAPFGPAARASLPAFARPSPVATFDNRVITMTARRLVEWGQDLVDAVRARVPDLKLDVRLIRTTGEVSVRNSNGLNVNYTRATLIVTATGLIVQDGLSWVSETRNLSGGQALDIGELADRIEERARWSRRLCSVATGTVPALLMPAAVPDFVAPLLAAADGKMLEKNSTPLAGRQGEAMLDPKFSLQDNPRRAHGTNSAPFDGEGTETRANAIFAAGAFKGFLFDLSTAAACGTATTGSARRDYTRLPAPGTTNIELEAGTTTLPAALAGLGHGLVVYGAIGGGQSNLLAGEVALSLSPAYLVENGAVAGRVKDVSLSGNVYDILKSIDAVGDRLQDLGSCALPFLVLPGVKVASRQ